MMEDTKKGTFILIEIISFIIFILLGLGIFYLFGTRNIKEKENDNKNEVQVKEVSLQYAISYELGMNVPVSLEKEEEEELYDLVKSLEFGPNETDCLIEPVYYLEYDNNKVYLDESCGIAIYNNEEASVTKGSKEIYEFLKKKVDTLNKVYLFKFDQEKQKATMIEVDDASKNQIRNIWAGHSKETMTMNLAILLQYYLYIDGDVIGIDQLDNYVSYNAAASHVMMLNQDMQEALSRYIESNSDCCSCCPDLKPGESCIAECCPCN